MCGLQKWLAITVHYFIPALGHTRLQLIFPVGKIYLLCSWNCHPITTAHGLCKKKKKDKKICFFSPIHLHFPEPLMAHSHTDGIRGQRLWRFERVFLMLSQLVKSAFTQIQQSSGKINTTTFICHPLGYLTARQPWEALLSSEDEAAILSYPFPLLNTCQEMKDKGAKSRKSIDGEMRLENWKGIELQWEEEELGV